MTRCQTCNKGFPQAYAIQRLASDGRLECIDCCVKREDREQLKRLHHVDHRCTHGPGDGACQCEPPAEHPDGY